MERRGRDSNPEAREGAGFRDRCIAVLPPLRGVLLIRAASRGGKRLTPLVRALFLPRLDGVRTGWDLNPRDICMPTRFPGVRLKPLGHPSRSLSKRRSRDSNPGGPVSTQRLSRAPPLATRPLLRQRPEMPSPGPNKKASAKALPFLHPRLARQGSNLDSPGPEPGVLPITPRANAAVLQRAPIIDDSPHRIKVLGHSSAGIVPLDAFGRADLWSRSRLASPEKQDQLTPGIR